jgi:hypothetical protein
MAEITKVIEEGRFNRSESHVYKLILDYYEALHNTNFIHEFTSPEDLIQAKHSISVACQFYDQLSSEQFSLMLADQTQV